MHLIMADGSVLPHAGQIRNILNQVDLKTGTLEVQGTFPNPEHVVLPGQFGRVRILMRQAPNSLLIPQKAVQEMQSLQSVFTLGPDDKVEVRNIVTGDRVGDDWIVQQGLKPGDRVIVEGIQKVRPGSVVHPTPYKVTTAAAASPIGG
jgi:membrane fusion protein (multidrug efflux system)